MAISFTVADDSVGNTTCAIISVRQLAAFRSFARTEGERTGITVVDENGQDFAPYDFEARVCPFALASLAAIFDHDETAIEVLEDAQFRARLIRFARDDDEGILRMWVATTPDGGLEFTVPDSNAVALLRALGIGDASAGSVSSHILRERLTDADVRAQLASQHLDHLIAPLTSLAWLSSDDMNARVVWA